MSVYFGYHMPSFSFPGLSGEGLFEHVADLAAAAESAGFDHVTVMDHFYQIGGVGPETEPMLEAYTTLGALAARTRRVKLGPLVTAVTYRNPALVAKMTTTLDVISSGRAILGMGAAWYEAEHQGYGFAFPPVGERMDRLDEALTIITRMFREERPSFEGRFYRIDRALNHPRPIQSGGPRILVGGVGERRTLRLVARYADMSNFFPMPMEDLKRKLRVLEKHCEAEGRDPAQIVKTVMVPFQLAQDETEARAIEARRVPGSWAGSAAAPERAAEILRAHLDAGFDGFTFRNATLDTRERIALAGELKRTLG